MPGPQRIIERPRSLRPAILALLSLTLLFSAVSDAQERGRRNAKNADSWSAEEYSGLRGTKELQTAMVSKAFTWITGSPADNEKLSIGKNAQFFGFVALRYQSGRAANRGMLGRAMFSIATEAQRDAMATAVRDERPALDEWWAVRDDILTLLEDHLYTGMPIADEALAAAGERFGLLNSSVAIHEARAYATFEDLMSEAQSELIPGWRLEPETATDFGAGVRVNDARVDSGDWKLLEDLYAKCFSWISGRREDNEIIPIGQPAQFFGFVSIRHKSGHGANRGNIARDFYKLLNSRQRRVIDSAVDDLVPQVKRFLDARHRYLDELEVLRVDSSEFDIDNANDLAREMGRLEAAIAKLEAEAYRTIRVSMSDEQLVQAMNMRGEYVIDRSQIETLETAERGATLSVLCAGCHGAPGAWRNGMTGPSLDGFWDRPIASAKSFDYSDALRSVSQTGDGLWTPELLDAFLANPRAFAPGTKMDFQGFLNPDDRHAIIQHLEVY